jgi:hypothetical protein
MNRPKTPLGPVVLLQEQPIRYRVNIPHPGAEGVPIVLTDADTAAFVVTVAHRLLGLDPPAWGSTLTDKQREDLTAKVGEFLRGRRLIE